MYNKILFVCPYPSGKAPSQRFRFEQYSDLLKNKNYCVHTAPFFTDAVWSILYKPGYLIKKIQGTLMGLLKRVILLFYVHHYDFIFIHREATPIGPPFFEWIVARWHKKKIIYDFDDAIWMPDLSSTNRIMSFLRWRSKVALICSWSHTISCGNSYLCHYAKKVNARAIVNPTTLDTDLLHKYAGSPKNESNSVVIGWTGSHSTLCYLNPLIPVIRSLSKKYDYVRFLVIADKKPTWDLACLDFVQWNQESEINDLMSMSFGIMPLSNDPWSQGKCGFKALQYMSLGKPTLASPVGVANDIVDHEVNGYICSNLEDWKFYMEKLIQKKDYISMGQRGREKVVQYYSKESNSSNFLSLFKD